LIAVKLRIRSREFAMLRPVGLDERGLNRLLFVEGLTFSLRPVLLRLPFLALICCLFRQYVPEDTRSAATGAGGVLTAEKKGRKKGGRPVIKILVVEDEPLIRDELTTILSNAGYTVDGIADFSNPVEHIKNTQPDLILLDVNLPGKDGYSLCAAIRSFSSTPIIFITGRNTAMDELQALTLGGDDYIAKPYNIPVMLARISRLINQGQPENQKECIEYKGISLNPIAGVLAFGGHEVELTKTELKIVYYLFTHASEIVSRLDLVEFLWDNEVHIDDNTLSVNVMRIRDKLRALGVDDLIQTKRGMGYKI
jgi:DNA-binding response OmpR family regulator